MRVPAVRSRLWAILPRMVQDNALKGAGGLVGPGAVDEIGEHRFYDAVLRRVMSASVTFSVLLVKNGW